jgi:hypothetical protein
VLSHDIRSRDLKLVNAIIPTKVFEVEFRFTIIRNQGITRGSKICRICTRLLVYRFRFIRTSYIASLWFGIRLCHFGICFRPI